MLWDTIRNIAIQGNLFFYPGGAYALDQYTATLSNCVVGGNVVIGPLSVIASGCTLGQNYFVH